MLFPQSFLEYKNMPKNKGKDSKKLYKEWLIVESQMQMLVTSIGMVVGIQSNTGVVGPSGVGNSAGGGGDAPLPPFPDRPLTYYYPDGSDGIILGYYTPDLDDGVNSYYIYV